MSVDPAVAGDVDAVDSPADPHFEHLESNPIFAGPVFTLVAERFRSPDGEVFSRQIVRNPGAVAIVPLHEDGTITLIRQFRPSLGRSIWEIPAGLRDRPGEAREAAAARELREEVGLVATSYVPLTTFAPAAGMTDEIITVYLATGLTQEEREADGAEERHLRIERRTLAEARAMIETGEIEDAKTIIGVLLTPARP